MPAYLFEGSAMTSSKTLVKLVCPAAGKASLRDRLDSGRAKVVPFKRTDPATAVIEKGRRLLQASRDAYAIPDLGMDPHPAKDRAQDAVWAHFRGPLSRTVPTTAAGCADLARYVLEFCDFQGVDLGEELLPILALIARSPLL